MGRSLASASVAAGRLGQGRRRLATPITEDPRSVLPGNLESLLRGLRNRLEAAFRPDTAAPVFGPRHTPSAGHCAAVATIVQQLAGGDLVSATVQGQSHWFNRLSVGDTQVDVDLTGDQFGIPPIRFGVPDGLFPETRVRTTTDLKPETLERAINLAKRAALDEVAGSLRRRLQSTLGPGRRT